MTTFYPGMLGVLPGPMDYTSGSVTFTGVTATSADAALAGVPVLVFPGQPCALSESALSGVVSAQVIGGTATASTSALAGIPAVSSPGQVATSTTTALSGVAELTVVGHVATLTTTALTGLPSISLSSLAATAIAAALAGNAAGVTEFGGGVATATTQSLPGVVSETVVGGISAESTQVPSGIPVLTVLGGVATTTITAPAGHPQCTFVAQQCQVAAVALAGVTADITEFAGQTATSSSTAPHGMPILVVTAGAPSLHSMLALAGSVNMLSSTPQQAPVLFGAPATDFNLLWGWNAEAGDSYAGVAPQQRVWT